MAKSPGSGSANGSSHADPVVRFIEELGKLPSGDHVIRGMVKPAEAADGVMFAHEGNCEHWVHIPASAMKTVRAAGHVRCDGHSHMVAEIQLNDPQDDLTRTFANVANLHRLNMARLQASLVSGSCSNSSQCPPNWHCGPDGNGGMKCLPGPF